ncbi:MAG TPA: ribosome maturation factor RimM [Fimbriimonadaceae bacterium]|nr:ribosome maturation factor RimM [Fimbriimonadaceae bacterium]
MSEFMRVGRIVGSFGIKGQVKVEPLTDFPERMSPGARIRLDNDWIEIQKASWHKNQLILTIEGVPDRTAADGLKWKYLEAPAGERPELDEDEYYTVDLINVEVFTAEGEGLGPVDDVIEGPAHDILVVGEIMIPAVKEFVKDVDLEAGRITVELIPGMRPGED